MISIKYGADVEQKPIRQSIKVAAKSILYYELFFLTNYDVVYFEYGFFVCFLSSLI